MINFYLAH